MVNKGPKKEKFQRVKPHCNIGTIGHVDHGKTTLTAAITHYLSFFTNTKGLEYADIDRNVEEKSRGITINATRVEYETENRHYTHIDCPGHQDYIKNMILGATQMDGVILVVAMTEGPKIQTREHLILANQIGLKYLLCYGNKMDAVLEKGLIPEVEMDIRAMVGKYGFEKDFPLVMGSARNALREHMVEAATDWGWWSIRDLMEWVDEWIVQPERKLDEPFLMPVEESLTIAGRGTVLTGKVERGELFSGQDVEIIGSLTYKTLCTGLEMYQKVLESAQAGENVGVLVRGVPYKKIKRGFVVAKPLTCQAHDCIIVRCYILSGDEGGRRYGFKSGYSPQFYFRTSNVTGYVRLKDDDDMVTPGEDAEFKVELISKVVIEKGLRFAIREGTKTVGAGIVWKIEKDLDDRYAQELRAGKHGQRKK